MTATSLSVIPKLERLSPLVFRVLGSNPGPYTLQGTNTYLIGAGKEKILIDTGEKGNNEYNNSLKEALSSESSEIVKIICTHWHVDHVGGIKDVLKVVNANPPVFKYPRSDQSEDPIHAPETGYKYLGDNEEVHVTGATLRVMHTPGHTTDHISLWLEEEKALFSGDSILGEGTAVFEDLHSYMSSLRKVLECKPGRIYPAHGSLIEDGTLKIEQYIKHRDMREAQILKALGSASAPISVEQIVDKVYQGLVEALKPAAASNVTHHLRKLVKDGKVREEQPDHWLAIDAKL